MVSAAFVPATPLSLAARPANTAPVARRSVTVMSVSRKQQAARLAASIPATLLTVAPALATEGTGEGLGIDTPLLYIPIVLIPGLFFVFFLQFGRSQNNEDFTGPYDERRN